MMVSVSYATGTRRRAQRQSFCSGARDRHGWGSAISMRSHLPLLTGDVGTLASLIPLRRLTLSALIFAGAGVQPASAATAWHKLKDGDLYVSLGSSIASGYGISVQSTS